MPCLAAIAATAAVAGALMNVDVLKQLDELLATVQAGSVNRVTAANALESREARTDSHIWKKEEVVSALKIEIGRLSKRLLLVEGNLFPKSEDALE